MSTTEVEYIVACMATREEVWLWKLLAGLSSKSLEPTVIHCDYQRCVKMSINLVQHDRMKHVEMKYHYVQEMVQRRAMEM